MGNKVAEFLSKLTRSTEEVLDDILILKFTLVNACMVGYPHVEDPKWALIDTGLENSHDFILDVVCDRYGMDLPPEAIILTHGHFDHIGSAISLSRHWDVPVFIHPLEIPYVTGKKDYPLGNPEVDSGLIAQMSQSFPHTAIDLNSRIFPLPEDGTIPYMPEWRYIHTPGHTVGHISLFREKDRTMIVGDAFSSTKQESLASVIAQVKAITGPPKYLTEDFKLAKESINKLKTLKPELAITSHGAPLKGKELTKYLDDLMKNYDELVIPV